MGFLSSNMIFNPLILLINVISALTINMKRDFYLKHLWAYEAKR